LDFLPDDTLIFVDESHVAVPQIGGMLGGDRSRKAALVEYGFRMPSAFDNRPLSFDEWEERAAKVIYVSATPGPYELRRSQRTVEMVVRPTGLVDPTVEVRPTAGQIDDLLAEVKRRTELGHRSLVTTLTKRFAEDLADYLREYGVKVRYLHSELDAMERISVLTDLRTGAIDVVVGINLLREGLDLPEVAFIGILDADKEGYLRAFRSFIQIIGRAARHHAGDREEGDLRARYQTEGPAGGRHRADGGCGRSARGPPGDRARPREGDAPPFEGAAVRRRSARAGPHHRAS